MGILLFLLPMTHGPGPEFPAELSLALSPRQGVGSFPDRIIHRSSQGFPVKILQDVLLTKPT